MSQAESEHRKPYLIVGLLCQLRYAGKHSDEEIAEKLGFENVEQMQSQLESWNIPRWLIGEKKAAAFVKRRNNSATRQARRSGPSTDLPPAGRYAGTTGSGPRKWRHKGVERLALRTASQACP
jgi:hypothetical protein